MKGKVMLVVGFFIGLVLAHWLKIVGTQYLWVLFYH